MIFSYFFQVPTSFMSVQFIKRNYQSCGMYLHHPFVGQVRLEAFFFFFFLPWRPPSHLVMFAYVNRNAQWLKFTWGFEPHHPTPHAWASILVCMAESWTDSVQVPPFLNLSVLSLENTEQNRIVLTPKKRCPCGIITPCYCAGFFTLWHAAAVVLWRWQLPLEVYTFVLSFF